MVGGARGGGVLARIDDVGDMRGVTIHFVLAKEFGRGRVLVVVPLGDVPSGREYPSLVAQAIFFDFQPRGFVLRGRNEFVVLSVPGEHRDVAQRDERFFVACRRADDRERPRPQIRPPGAETVGSLTAHRVARDVGQARV